MESYKRGSHTVWDCKYHIVWITKYRFAILGGDVGQRCRELVRETARAHEMVIHAGSMNRDHVHLLLSIPPSLSVSRAVQYLKGRSSRRRSTFALVKFLSRLFTALNLLPSIATLAFKSRPIRRHSSTKRAQTFLMAPPLSLRKSAIVLWSGANRPSSHITSTLRPASRSSRRLDCTRLR